jgi:hypothetical protein
MNWVERKVPSLKLCKRLKELGFPQNSPGWYWVVYHDNDGDEVQLLLERDKTLWKMLRNCSPDYREVTKAPTCREMEKWLPYFIEEENNILRRKTNYYLCLEKLRKDFYKIYYKWKYNEYYDVIPSNCIEADTELNARAKILIWLYDNGYVKFKVTE